MARKLNKQDAGVALSPERMLQLQQQAETQAVAELEKEAEKQFLAAAIARKKRELAGLPDDVADADEEIDEVHIDLAPHAAYITIDGRVFFHGHTYKFRRSQVPTINEIMSRTWAHESEIGGANMNAVHGRRPYNATLRPTH